MNWLLKLSQIPAAQLPSQKWYHGTDSVTAYSLMNEMALKPRSETGESSYSGSLSSMPERVYLTLSTGKAAKHATERTEAVGNSPVILVINPEDLGYTHVDEDLVHMILNGNTYFDSEWYPSPKLEEEIFDLAEQALGIETWDENISSKKNVLNYIEEYKMYGTADDASEDEWKEYMEEEGIIPDESGVYEYDKTMHVAKRVAQELNDKHQQEAIMNFQSMAHVGRVKASEIYLLPSYIERPMDDGSTWKDSITSLKNYEELQQFGEKINPHQLLMPFMTEKAASNWLQKLSHQYEQLFHELSQAQRGVPERAMLQLQRAAGGGVLGYVAEHIGDLTHRMSESPTSFNAGYEYVLEKVKKTLRILTNPYGFEKEMKENAVANAQYWGASIEDYWNKVNAALENYAIAHRQLPVYNEVQKIARNAAVALGEKRFNTTISLLYRLQDFLEKGTEEWKEKAHYYDEQLSQEDQRLRDELQKTSQSIPPSYIGVGHGYRFNDETGQMEELWQSGDTNPVILWSYEDGYIKEEYRTKNNTAHWSTTDLARGRIETGSNRGSIDFTDSNLGIRPNKTKKMIIEALVIKYPEVKFVVYGEPGGPFSLQKYWEGL